MSTIASCAARPEGYCHNEKGPHEGALSYQLGALPTAISRLEASTPVARSVWGGASHLSSRCSLCGHLAPKSQHFVDVFAGNRASAGSLGIPRELSWAALRASMPASLAPHSGAEAVQVASPAAGMALGRTPWGALIDSPIDVP